MGYKYQYIYHSLGQVAKVAQSGEFAQIPGTENEFKKSIGEIGFKSL